MKIKIKNRPIYSLYLTLKYNLIHFIFGSLTVAEYDEMVKIIAPDEEYKYRLDRLTE